MKGAVLALIQGVYFVATGLWPILHMRSFERVTGPKTDKWLAQAVGTVVAAIGAGLLVDASRRRVAPATIVIASASAAALAAVDSIYAARRRISPVYFLDAIAEIALVIGWARVWQTGRRAESDEPDSI